MFSIPVFTRTIIMLVLLAIGVLAAYIAKNHQWLALRTLCVAVVIICTSAIIAMVDAA